MRKREFFPFLMAFIVLKTVLVMPSMAQESLNWNHLLNVLNKSPVHSDPTFKRLDQSSFGMTGAEAEDMESAIDKIASEHLPGVQVIKTGSGVGFIATGAGVYKRYNNINATRLSQRQAYVVAFMKAKKELSVALKGMSVEGKQELAQSVFQRDSDNISSSESSSAYREMVSEAVQAVLSGYTTYEVFDDGANTVYVTLVTTPKTRSACLSISGALVDASSLGAGMDRVFREITAGVVPPVGGRVINVPETGEVAFVSFGSSIIKETGDNAQNAQEKLISQRRARARADSSMVAILRGDDYMWSYGFNSALDKDAVRYKDYVEDEEVVASESVLMNRKSTFMSSFRGSEQASSVVKGRLPEGTSSKTWYSKDGGWVFVADVYLTSSRAHARQAASEMVGYKPDDLENPIPVKVEKKREKVQEDYKETSSVKIDWDDGYVTIMGEAVAPDGMAYSAQGKLMAKRGAMVDLQRNFLEFIEGVRLNSKTTMKDLMVEDDIVNSRARGLVKGVEVYSGKWDGEIYTLYGRMSVDKIKGLVESFKAK